MSEELTRMTNIYVGNLAQRVTEEEIREAFGLFGQVGKIRIVVDQETNRSLGYAFVEMTNPNDAKAAIVKKGFGDAFVVGDMNGYIIPADEADELMKQP